MVYSSYKLPNLKLITKKAASDYMYLVWNGVDTNRLKEIVKPENFYQITDFILLHRK